MSVFAVQPYAAEPFDARLHAAAGLLERPKRTPSGLAILLAVMALCVTAAMLVFFVTPHPKTAPITTTARPPADFQLSGSAFPDTDAVKPVTPGSEPSR